MTKRTLMMTKHRPADKKLYFDCPDLSDAGVDAGVSLSLLLRLPGVRECRVVTVQGFTFVSRRSKTRSACQNCRNPVLFTVATRHSDSRPSFLE